MSFSSVRYDQYSILDDRDIESFIDDDAFGIHIPPVTWWRIYLEMLDYENWKENETRFYPFKSRGSNIFSILELNFKGGAFNYRAFHRPNSWIQPFTSLRSI